MSKIDNPRETGSVFFLALVLTFMIFTLTGSLVLLAMTRSRSVAETINLGQAQYLAEGALAASKRELTYGYDLGEDGVGNVSFDSDAGSYSAEAVSLGNGFYRITAKGVTESGYVVSLQQVTELSNTSRFPNGAISIVGDADDSNFDFKMHKGLILDGAEDPAVTFTDSDLFEDIAEEFAEAINDGDLPESNITGGRTTEITFDDDDDDGGSIDLAMAVEDNYDKKLEDLSALYDDLVSSTKSLIDDDDVIIGDEDDSKYGSEENPVLVHFKDDAEIESKLDGHGVLILSDEFKIEEDATVTWTGDVIVMGEDDQAKVEIEGKFVIVGNLVVLGEGDGTTELKIEDDGDVSVDGSLFFGSSYDPDEGEKVELELEGDLDVDGLMTLAGTKVVMKLKSDSDLAVVGMLQMSLSDVPGSKLDLEFKGDVEIHKNSLLIAHGAAALGQLGVSLSAPELGKILRAGNQDHFWTKIHDQ